MKMRFTQTGSAGFTQQNLQISGNFRTNKILHYCTYSASSLSGVWLTIGELFFKRFLIWLVVSLQNPPRRPG
ncbi:hypothetical protein GOODEAATRI_000815 [Goodea atripinnis]|uniref:Uncharacterized protein n=1 Tax=Goodea atripinnis TaxID=208336 RepID=A0ABV0N861_9TELE